MGKVYFDDLSTTWKNFEKLAGDADGVAMAIMLHGAKEMIEEWRDTIEDEELIDTGAMHDSVAMVGKPKKKNGVWEVTVAPTGVDDKGTRNAMKAAILNYGTSSITGRHFIDSIERMSESAIPTIAQYIMDMHDATGVIPSVDPSSLKAIRRKKTKKKG